MKKPKVKKLTPTQKMQNDLTFERNKCERMRNVLNTLVDALLEIPEIRAVVLEKIEDEVRENFREDLRQELEDEIRDEIRDNI